MFGNEARGLPAEVVERCDEGVRVPLYGTAESLNLAMAATVCLYASAGAQHRSFDAMVRHGEIEPATREFSAPRRQLLRSGRTTAPIGDELRGDR